jgi:MFS transporter, DHA3 family, macrolide efflux protein
MPIAILEPLFRRSIRRIWSGQVLASIGTELYSVAVLWTAVGLVDRDAGYVATLQAAAVLVGSLLTGTLTDRWRHTTTLIAADLARAVAVLALPLADALGWMSWGMLLAVALLVGVMTGCFDPVLQAALAPLVPESRLRHATNGLFDATRRLARIAGPALIFVVHQAVSTIHFFIVTAASFAASATMIATVAREHPEVVKTEAPGAVASIFGGFRALRGHPMIIYALCASAVANIAWAGGYLFGMALVFRHERPESLTGYSLMACAYGVGNLLSNLVIASFPPMNPARRVAVSKLIFGVGIILIALGPPLPWLMLIAALMAVNGPLGDLTLVHMLQASFPPAVLVRVFRAQICMVWGGMLAGYLLAPLLLFWLPLSSMIQTLGAASAVAGLVGLPLSRVRRDK